MITSTPILDRLPRAASSPIAVRVTAAAERQLRGGHPWLFEGSMVQQSRAGQPGDLAVIFDRKGRFLAVGLLDPDVSIRVRILQIGHPAEIDRAWLRLRLVTAAQVRAGLPRTGTTGYRLVHGENDGLPGLVVDRYDETLAVKLYTPAWIPHLRDICWALGQVVAPERLVLRLSRAARQRKQHLHGLEDGTTLAGPPLKGPVEFLENGLRFEADVMRGQKTGFFLDQRENRARVERLAASYHVLNVFAYTGGFSVYAARGGASGVLSVDRSRLALEAATRNFDLNRSHPAVAGAHHEWLVEDAFRALARFASMGRRFNLVIVDPPAFAHREGQVSRALAAYGRLTRLALAVLRGGGTLVQASCSSSVISHEFFAAVHRAASEMGRPLVEIERTGHPIDHPIGFPQGAYLKCLFAVAS